jgi:hypothetical protein
VYTRGDSSINEYHCHYILRQTQTNLVGPNIKSFLKRLLMCIYGNGLLSLETTQRIYDLLRLKHA